VFIALLHARPGLRTGAGSTNGGPA
jgi:hypothetical protein